MPAHVPEVPAAATFPYNCLFAWLHAIMELQLPSLLGSTSTAVVPGPSADLGFCPETVQRQNFMAHSLSSSVHQSISVYSLDIAPGQGVADTGRSRPTLQCHLFSRACVAMNRTAAQSIAMKSKTCHKAPEDNCVCSVPGAWVQVNCHGLVHRPWLGALSRRPDHDEINNNK